MKEKNLCRCCSSEECYKDMTNTYYIGNKTENYFEMLLNIFNITIINDDAERCLICEECVTKLRDAAAFKKRVQDIQEALKNNFSWDNTDMDTKIEDLEDTDYFDDFDDNISDKDFIWDNFTDNGSQKGQLFVITLNSTVKTQNKDKTITKPKQTKPYDKEFGNTNENSSKLGAKENIKNPSTFGAKENIKNPSTFSATQNVRIPRRTLGDKEIDNLKNPSQHRAKQKEEENPITLPGNEKDGRRNSSTLGAKQTDEVQNLNILDEILSKSADNFSTVKSNVEDIDFANKSRNTRKRILSRKTVIVKACTANQNKDKAKKTKCKRREVPQTDLGLKYKSENTLKLVQNSNLCLFRSLRNKFGCNYCPLTFPEFNQLREHSLSHKNPILSGIKRLRGLSCKNADISDLKCNLCSQSCTDLQNLMDHLKKQHEISFHETGHYLVPYKLQNGHQCALCELKFNTYLRLSCHMNTHFMNNVCDKCGLSFINRIGLRTHVQAQHKEKKCPRCPAFFLTVSAKSKHLRQIHGLTTTKRYCNLCNKTFKYTYMLEAHKIQDHNAKKPAVSICVVCGKNFVSQLSLKTHFRSVHLKERNYPCSKCGMRFFTSCDKRRHERTHEDVRSFCCSYCDAKFKSKDSWRRHLKRQHGHVFGKTAAT